MATYKLSISNNGSNVIDVTESTAVYLDFVTTAVPEGTSVNFDFAGTISDSDVQFGLGARSFAIGPNGFINFGFIFLDDAMPEDMETLTVKSLDDPSQSVTINVNDMYIPSAPGSSTFPATGSSTSPVFNNPPSGNLVIEGLAQAGQTLEVSAFPIYDADGVNFDSFSYKWFVNGNQVAFGEKYTVNKTDTGKIIRIEGNYTDNLGTVETVKSNDVTVLTASNTPTSGDVKIDGTPKTGQTLFANTSNLFDQDGGIDYGSFNYQWFVNGNPTFNGNNYAITNADAGKNILVKVSFRDLQGNNEEKISDSIFVSQPPSYSLFADKPNVTEGETINLVLQTQNVSAGTAVNFIFNGSATLADIQGNFIPSSFFVNTDGKTSISLNFLNDKQKEGMENMTFTLIDDSTKSATLNINDGFVPNTPATGSVFINGEPKIGNTLSATPNNVQDADGLGVFKFQWLANGNPILGQMTQNYTLTQQDENKNISVELGFIDGGGNQEKLSSSMMFVQAAPKPSYSLFADKPNLNEGETTNLILQTQNAPAGKEIKLNFMGSATTADVQGNFIPASFFVNADGKASISLSFLNDKMKEGTENLIFRLIDDPSKTVTININDGFIPNTPATGSIFINGEPKIGNTLSATPNNVQDVDGLGNFKFQWLLNGNPIAGQNSANYTLTQQDENKNLSVELSFVDGTGNQEKLNSSMMFVQAAPKLSYNFFADKPNLNEGETTNLILQTQNVPAGKEIKFKFMGNATTADVQGNFIPASFFVNADGKTSIPLTFLNDKLKEGTENLTFTLIDDPSKTVTININDGINDSNPQPQNNTPPTGQIFIEGDAKIGKTLRVKIDNVQDADGLGTFNFQWLRDGKPLAGKTSQEYVLEKDDAGKNINVQLSYTDKLGQLEMLNSMPITTSGSSNSPISPTGTTTLTAQNPNFKGTGTNADNIEGSAIGDNIAGVLGNDTLRGADGDDTIEGGNGNDQLFGDADGDLLDGGDGDDLLTGGDDNDTLDGGDGNDTLDGSAGADSMTGGDGDDEYFIDNVGDEVIESTSAIGGKDTVISQITWQQTSGIETINLKGENDIDATGDDKANTITGNLGNNRLTGNGGNDSLFGNESNDTLDGGTGADYLNGGEGDDVYIIDNSADVIEDDDGKDSVQSSKTISLVVYPTIENLDLIGDDSINGTGNKNNNIITGNAADNELKGMDGDDILFGNDGDDTLVGGDGNNVLDGGNDEDTAVYNGVSSDYDLQISDSVTVTNILTGEIDELIDMEFVQFNDETLPIVGQIQELVLSVADVKIKEGNIKNGTVKASVILKLDKAPDEEVSVDVTTEDITAISGEDYVSFTKTVTFKANQKIQKIRLDIKSDTLTEEDETFALLLSNPSDNVTLENSEAIVTILNDDKPTISIQNASVTEGAIGKMNAQLQVNLSSASTLPVTVSYKTVNGTAKSPIDYTVTKGKLTFDVGETSKTILVPIVDDKIAEASEQFRVTLSSAKNATLATESTAKVTIIDNDKSSTANLNIVESSASQEIVEQDSNVEIQITGTTQDFGL